MIKKQGTIFFMIVQQKVLQGDEAFVMMAKPWLHEKKINPDSVLWIWPQKWVLNF